MKMAQGYVSGGGASMTGKMLGAGAGAAQLAGKATPGPWGMALAGLGAGMAGGAALASRADASQAKMVPKHKGMMAGGMSSGGSSGGMSSGGKALAGGAAAGALGAKANQGFTNFLARKQQERGEMRVSQRRAWDIQNRRKQEELQLDKAGVTGKEREEKLRDFDLQNGTISKRRGSYYMQNVAAQERQRLTQETAQAKGRQQKLQAKASSAQAKDRRVLKRREEMAEAGGRANWAASKVKAGAGKVAEPYQNARDWVDEGGLEESVGQVIDKAKHSVAKAQVTVGSIKSDPGQVVRNAADSTRSVARERRASRLAHHSAQVKELEKKTKDLQMKAIKSKEGGADKVMGDSIGHSDRYNSRDGGLI
jgi:hypothetical protein